MYAVEAKNIVTTVARSRALVAREIPSHDAWFTTARESQEVEDRMAALENADPATRAAALRRGQPRCT